MFRRMILDWDNYQKTIKLDGLAGELVKTMFFYSFHIDENTENNYIRFGICINSESSYAILQKSYFIEKIGHYLSEKLRSSGYKFRLCFDILLPQTLFSIVLRKEMDDKDMDCVELAKKTGINHEHIIEYYLDGCSHFEIDEVQAISAAIGKSVDEMMLGKFKLVGNKFVDLVNGL